MNPTPWAAYAFHPFEAIFEAGIIPLLLMLIPLHRTAFYLFSAIMLWANLYGHIGFEFMSPRIAQHPIFRWLNTGLNHNYHHRHFQGNYGLYFTFWDWLMGTLRVPDSNLGSEFDDPRGEELLGKNKLSG
jgi:sterol desaturase/sphingolipid hydroxylase (fatty acid hydroxylase superfamily)